MKSTFIRLIKYYQNNVSSTLGASKCIFTPTCSNYALEAIEKKGAFRGFFLSAWRVLRCNPFNKTGGYDPVK